MPEFVSDKRAHVREWRQLAPPGEDVEARRDELEAICRDLLGHIDNDRVWRLWQVVRDHLAQFQMEQLADVNGVRESNRALEEAAHSVRMRLRGELNKAIRLHERAAKRKWYGRMIVNTATARQLADKDFADVLGREAEHGRLTKGDKWIVGPAARPWQRFPRFYARVWRVLAADPILNYSASRRRRGNPEKSRNAALRADLLEVLLEDGEGDPPTTAKLRVNAILWAIGFSKRAVSRRSVNPAK